jgi:hypothetical protein
MDDIGHIDEGPVNNSLNAYQYIEVHLVNDKVNVKDRGILDSAKPQQPAIQMHIMHHRESHRSEHEDDDSNQIPLDLIANFAIPKFLALQPTFEESEMEDEVWYDELRRMVTKLNGKVQTRDARGFCRLYYVTIPLPDRSVCLDIITTAQKEALEILTKMAGQF